MEVFVTWKQEKGLASLMTALKRGGIESRLMEFVPLNKRTEEHFRAAFEERGLADIVKLHKAQVKIKFLKCIFHLSLLLEISNNALLYYRKM